MVLRKGVILNRLKKIFSVCDIDKLVISNAISGCQDANFKYLTDFTSGLFEGDYLIADRNGIKLFCYPLEYETAIKQSSKDIDVVRIDSWDKMRDSLINELHNQRTGVNGGYLPLNTYTLLKNISSETPLDISKSLMDARITKDEYEIRRIKKACKLTKAAIKETMTLLRKNVTEKNIAEKFAEILVEKGADSTSFESIVCFGKNASQPHHSPDMTKLKNGDFVLIDVGAKVDNYCSDITRTILFGKGNDYKKKEEMVDLVLATQNLAIKSIRPGELAKSIHSLAESNINSYADGIYKGKFIHSLGHSLGLEVHDGGGLGSYSDIKLADNMVFTVEPGIYIEGFGGVRFEDDIVIRKNGTEVL